MKPTMRPMLLAGLAVLAATGPARAQFVSMNAVWVTYPGSTVPGDVLRGAGPYFYGLGAYNLATAHAFVLRQEAAIRLQNHIYVYRRKTAARYKSSRDRDQAHSTASLDGKAARLRRNPEALDIAKGDAQNALIDDLLSLSGWAQAPEMDARVEASVVRSLPLRCNRLGVTASLGGKRPRGGIDPRFRAGVIEADPEGYRDFVIRLDQRGSVSLRELLTFLHAFDLRLGVAEAPDQKRANRDLHSHLAAAHEGIGLTRLARGDDPDR